MLKKTITFKDLEGNEVTKDFYFNLSKAEIAEMELSTEGGLTEKIEKMVEKSDGKAIIETFRDILRLSYGVKSPDGIRFIKTEELWLDFMQSDAYSELFMELVTNAEASATFVKGIVPAGLGEEAESRIKELKLPIEDDKENPKLGLVVADAVEPAWIREDREPTQSELLTMSKEELQAAYIRRMSSR